MSRHRIGTAEVEDAINTHESVVESAVVGYPHDIKGQGIFAYVIPAGNVSDPELFSKQVNSVITEMIKPIFKDR